MCCRGCGQYGRYVGLCICIAATTSRVRDEFVHPTYRKVRNINHLVWRPAGVTSKICNQACENCKHYKQSWRPAETQKKLEHTMKDAVAKMNFGLCKYMTRKYTSNRDRYVRYEVGTAQFLEHDAALTWSIKFLHQSDDPHTECHLLGWPWTVP